MCDYANSCRSANKNGYKKLNKKYSNSHAKSLIPLEIEHLEYIDFAHSRISGISKGKSNICIFFMPAI